MIVLDEIAYFDWDREVLRRRVRDAYQGACATTPPLPLHDYTDKALYGRLLAGETIVLPLWWREQLGTRALITGATVALGALCFEDGEHHTTVSARRPVELKSARRWL